MKKLVTTVVLSSFVFVSSAVCQSTGETGLHDDPAAVAKHAPTEERAAAQSGPSADQDTPEGQTKQPETTPGNEAVQPSTSLEVKPGPPVIKKKDLYEGPGYFHPFTRMPRYVWHDQTSIWTSPFHTSRHNAKYWAIFGGASIALIATDKWTVKQLPNTSSQVRIGKIASNIGAAYSLIPITAGFYFIGSAVHNERFRETGLLSFEALVDSTLVETAIKAVTQRERPLEGNGNGAFWSGKGKSVWNAGFPSGHAINSWALASIWAHQYRHTVVVPIVVYGLATAVSVARVGSRRHFPGDTVAGAAMGWFIGDYVYGKRHNPALDEKKSVVSKALDGILDRVSIGFSFQ